MTLQKLKWPAILTVAVTAIIAFCCKYQELAQWFVEPVKK